MIAPRITIGSDRIWPIVTQPNAEVTELLVRHAHELDQDPEHAVEHQEQPRRGRGRPRLARVEPQHEGQHDTLEERLVELARVARLAVHDHGPRRIGARDLPQSSPLMKLPMRPKKMPPDAPRRDRIGEIEELDPTRPAVEPHRDQHAGQSAVERHAALPHREDAERVGEQLLVRVDEHVADPAADDRAERAVEHDVVDAVRLHLAPRQLRARRAGRSRRAGTRRGT